MVHHQEDILHDEAVEGCAFGDDAPDQNVVVFHCALLVGCLGIAVEETAPWSALQVVLEGGGVGKLASVIG